MDEQRIAEIVATLDRIKAKRPALASRVDRAEHILTVQLSVMNGQRPIKVRRTADGRYHYVVKSGAKLTKTYKIDPVRWECTCPDYRKRNKVCKHGIACYTLESVG